MFHGSALKADRHTLLHVRLGSAVVSFLKSFFIANANVDANAACSVSPLQFLSSTSSCLDSFPFLLGLNLLHISSLPLLESSLAASLFIMSDPTKGGQEPTTVGNLPIATSTNVSEKETATEDAVAKVAQSTDDEDAEPEFEPQPHLHAKTFLAVSAVYLIYFAQVFSLVGAGAVSFENHQLLN